MNKYNNINKCSKNKKSNMKPPSGNSRKYVEDKLINSEITDNFKKFITKTSDHILETLTTGLKLIQNHENTKSTDFNTLHTANTEDI
jgi:hypothetical protein